MGLKLSDKVKSVIAAVAPTLGTALGGPLGGLAGSILAKTVGGDDKAVAAALEEQTPEAIAKLQEAEKTLLLEMERLSITREQLVFADIADARARDVSLHGDGTTKMLAYMVVGAFIAMAFSVLFKLTVAESTLSGTIIGYMSAKAEQVVGYYFGSSLGSKQKTDELAKAMQK